MNQFYVYGLIDPRTSSIFYIGKGKGRRVFQHENEKDDIHSNTQKLRTIREIRKEGFVINHVIIADNLNEKSAFLLEKILVYRLGRRIFDEGCLSNITPGGAWKKGDSLFLKKDDFPNDETIKEFYPELMPVLINYPYSANKFAGFKCPINPDDENLYEYNISGLKTNIWDIDKLIDVFGLSHSLDLLNHIKQTDYPIFAWGRVWCKSDLPIFENISQIPFQDFDILNIDFIKKVNSAVFEEIPESFKFYSNDLVQSEITISYKPLEINLTCYYLNGNKKHTSRYLDNKLDGRCLSWHSNGNLKEDAFYVQGMYSEIHRFFYNGSKEFMEIRTKDNRPKIFKMWYENGQLRSEKNHLTGEYVAYSEDGLLITECKRDGLTEEEEEEGILLFDYDDRGRIRKETKRYYVNGLLYGYEKTFYDSGEVKRFVDYTNGYDKKEITSYKKNGEISNINKNGT